MENIESYEKLDLCDFDFEYCTYPPHPNLEAPGIYALYCSATNRAKFLHSQNVLGQIESDSYKLYSNQYDTSDALVADFETFACGGFQFIIFTVGEEWEDFEKRHDEVEKLKKNWPYGLYMENIESYEKLDLCDFDFEYCTYGPHPNLEAPGIYALYCSATNRAEFGHSRNVLGQIESDSYKLYWNQYETPDALVEDFETFRCNEFQFIIFTVGEEWEDFEKRHDEMEKLKKNWPYGLYFE